MSSIKNYAEYLKFDMEMTSRAVGHKFALYLVGSDLRSWRTCRAV